MQFQIAGRCQKQVSRNQFEGPVWESQVCLELGEREGTEEDFPQEMANNAVMTFFLA